MDVDVEVGVVVVDEDVVVDTMGIIEDVDQTIVEEVVHEGRSERG